MGHPWNFGVFWGIIVVALLIFPVEIEGKISLDSAHTLTLHEFIRTLVEFYCVLTFCECTAFMISD